MSVSYTHLYDIHSNIVGFEEEVQIRLYNPNNCGRSPKLQTNWEVPCTMILFIRYNKKIAEVQGIHLDWLTKYYSRDSLPVQNASATLR